mgnify:CR=1 FL=1
MVLRIYTGCWRDGEGSNSLVDIERVMILKSRWDSILPVSYIFHLELAGSDNINHNKDGEE